MIKSIMSTKTKPFFVISIKPKKVVIFSNIFAMRMILVFRKMAKRNLRRMPFRMRAVRIIVKYRKRSQGVQKRRKKYSTETRWLSS